MHSGARTSVYTFGRHGALLASEELTEEQAREETRRLADVEATELPSFRFEHDSAARAVRITAAEGLAIEESQGATGELIVAGSGRARRRGDRGDSGNSRRSGRRIGRRRRWWTW